jgi:hypothetical protein
VSILNVMHDAVFDPSTEILMAYIMASIACLGCYDGVGVIALFSYRVVFKSIAHAIVFLVEPHSIHTLLPCGVLCKMSMIYSLCRYLECWNGLPFHFKRFGRFLLTL